MQRFQDIHYLRWARAQAAPPHPEIALILSGMMAPDPALLGDFSAAQLLDFPVGDHPPLARRFAEQWRVAPERVLVQPGTHLSILLLTAARLGDVPGPVVVEEPAYEPLWRIPEALGAPLLRWPRVRERGWALDPTVFDRLVAQKPSLVILSQPHNPTGAVLTAEDRALLRRLQAATGCAILSDEVYLEFLADPESHTWLHEGGDGVILRSFTKVMGLGSVRCTGSAGHVGWIARAAAITDHAAVALPGPSHAVAHRAWDHRGELWSRARAAADAGRAEVEAFSARVRDLMDVDVAPAGIITFPRLHEAVHEAAVAAAIARGVRGPFGYGLDAFEEGSQFWIEDLRRQKNVQLTPGAFFEDPRAFRLGYGVDAGVLREGLRRLEEHLRGVMEKR